LASARQVPEGKWRAYAILGVVAGQAERGDSAGAARTATTITEPGGKDLGLVLVARAQARRGDVRRALATARTIGADEVRLDALFRIAHEQAPAGNVAGAVSIVGLIPEQADRQRR
jgi:hypothetical protein